MATRSLAWRALLLGTVLLAGCAIPEPIPLTDTGSIRDPDLVTSSADGSSIHADAPFAPPDADTLHGDGVWVERPDGLQDGVGDTKPPDAGDGGVHDGGKQDGARDGGVGEKRREGGPG